MNKLPPFTLPSCAKKQYVFKEPTVADCVEFSGLQEIREEALTSVYLSHLLEGDGDPRDWTAEDRRTALWWIWVHINTESEDATKLKFDYHCPHCEKEHATKVDLVELDEGLVMLDKLPEKTGCVPYEGKELEFKIKPLTGHDLEAIEELRVERSYLDNEVSEFAQLSAKIRTMELAGCIEFLDEDNQDKPVSERIEARLNRIMSFPKERVFRPIAQQVMLHLASAHHGLDCIYEEGSVKLISPPNRCLNYEAPEGAKEGAVPSTVLHLDFRPNNFIPAV
mgnify:CR=1 FL=1